MATVSCLARGLAAGAGDNARVTDMGLPPPDSPDPGAVLPPTLPGPEAPPARRSRGLVLGLVLALAAGAGVGIGLGLRGGSSDDAARLPAASPLPAGWELKTLRAEGFAVGLPPSWQDVPTSSADEALRGLREANPAIAALVENQLGGTVSEFIKLLAFDLESPTLTEEFVTNMNVVVAPVPDGVGFEQFVEANLDQLRTVPGLAGDIERGSANLPSGEAAIVRSRLTLQSPGGEKVAAITQYLLVRGARGYIVSFSTTPTHDREYAKTFLAIMDSFRYA